MYHRHLKAYSQGRQGTAAVELVVLLPLLAFLFGIAVDFARSFYFLEVIQNCARNGALYASDPVAQAESPYSNTEAAALSDATNLTPHSTVSSATGTDVSGNASVQVTVACQFQSVTDFPGIPSMVTLNRTVQMRMASQ